MPRRFLQLFLQNLDSLTRAWVDAIYADRRTDLATLLSFRELVEHVPEVLEELGRLLDDRAGPGDLAEGARRVRSLAQARFQQGALVDEVARELMLLRDTLVEFLWKHAADARELRETTRGTTSFFDELIAQAILVYAVSLRPVVPTRGSVWPPPRNRRGGRP